jgi:hypothetical protein
MLAAMRALLAPLALALALSSVGCATWSTEIRQAEVAYDEARPDDAIVWLDAVGDENVGRLELGPRARYLYLRGMTEFRLGRRDDALYHLTLAREVAGEGGVGLRAEHVTLLNRTLTELTPNSRTHLAQQPSLAHP